MFVLVLSAEADETRQTMTLLIASLIGIAVVLALLTVWYWLFTDPRRQGTGGRTTRGEAGPATGTATASMPDPGGDEAGEAARSTGPTDRRGAAASAGTGSETAGGPRQRDESGSESESGSGATLARQTWDYVAAARRAEEEGSAVRRPDRPAAPRIEVAARSSSAAGTGRDDTDELAAVRKRKEREVASGLSDEAWQTVRRSVFDKLDR